MSHPPDVLIERAHLTRGIPAMHRDFGPRIRLAYDPDQITQAAALAWLHTRIPRLADGYGLHIRE